MLSHVLLRIFSRRLIVMSKDRIKQELCNSIAAGDVEKVQHFMNSKYSETLPFHISSVLDALVKKDLPTACLPHRCLTDYTSIEGSINLPPNSVSAARRELLQYLIEFDKPHLDLNAVTSDGLAVIHTAVIYGDSSSLSILITKGAASTRRNRLDIDKRCHVKSWTAIHYSIDCVNIEALRLLLRAGSDLSLGDDAPPADASTPAGKSSKQGSAASYLKMVKAKLKGINSAGPNGPTAGARKTVQLMADELQAAFDARRLLLKKSESDSTASSSNGDKVNDANPNDEMELVAFYEKTRGGGGSGNVPGGASSSSKKAPSGKAAQPTATTGNPSKKESNTPSVGEVKSSPSTTGGGGSNPNPNSNPPPSANKGAAANVSDSKKKKKGEKEKPPVPSAASASATPSSGGVAAASASAASTKSSTPSPAAGKGAGAGAGAKGLPAATAMSRSSSAPATMTSSQKNTGAKNSVINVSVELSVASRDELVDRLLAMGFKEADCLAAISLYGTDVDRAISWLCEKPPIPAPSDSKVRSIAEASSPPVNAAPESAPVASAAVAAAAVAAGINVTPGSTITIANPAKLQKEKEELRRINRAWNAKAEDEKKKVFLFTIVIKS